MPKSDGYKNLIPANKRSKDEARMLGKEGGIKSGEARRLRKTMREELLLLLEDGNIQENLCVALIDKALEGDIKAFQIIRDTIGEKPIEKINMTSANVNLQESYEKIQAIMEEQKRKLIEENGEKETNRMPKD